jgi:hypothetical protein
MQQAQAEIRLFSGAVVADAKPKEWRLCSEKIRNASVQGLEMVNT